MPEIFKEMKGSITGVLLLLCVVLQAETLFAQEDARIAEIKNRLFLLADSNDVGGLREKISASVSNVGLGDFVIGIAISNNLNISVDPSVNITITVNFVEESVINILTFLCKQYTLEINFTGSIMYLKKYIPPAPTPQAKEPLNIKYDGVTNRLTLDLKSDTLQQVVKRIVELSDKNIILSPAINNKIVTAYIKDLPFEKALEQLAYANDMEKEVADSNVFILTKASDKRTVESKDKKTNAKGIPETGADFSLQINTNDAGDKTISLTAINTPTAALIKLLCQELELNYFVFSEPPGNATVKVQNLTFDSLLNYIFKATEYNHKKEGGIYLFGARTQEGFTSSKFIQLQYRSVNTVMENIPSDLKKGVEVKTFVELNSLILNGPAIKILEIEKFIRDIDKVVPVIMIEVIIVDVNSSRTTKAGLSMGLSETPVETGGTILPGLDMTLGSSSINKLLDLFAGTGLANIGKVTPNFYVNIKALEEQGYLNVRSTPRLSTLNGHEATLSIGRTDYYVEQTNNIIGTQNPQTVVTTIFKPIKADFSLKINPIVSGEDHITLDITVSQSVFTSRISPNAPPGSSNREFKSMIRVKSDEMVMLGGLEESENGNSGTGLPLLSRIPVLRWFFGNREKTRRKTKLNIFIKPVIIY